MTKITKSNVELIRNVKPKKTNTTKTRKVKTEENPNISIIHLDEFRTHRKNGHPAYVFLKNGLKIEFYNLTHSEITHKVKNIPLKTNPNPKDNRPAYFRPHTQIEPERNLKKHKKYDNWQLSNEDKEKYIKNKKVSDIET